MVCNIKIEEKDKSTIAKPNKSIFTGKVNIAKGSQRGCSWLKPNVWNLGKLMSTTIVPSSTYIRLIPKDRSSNFLFFIHIKILLRLIVHFRNRIQHSIYPVLEHLIKYQNNRLILLCH